MILSLHLATSNLPPKGMDISDAQYPWPVQIACILFEMAGHDRAVFNSRVRADGRTIASGATQVHGITSREAGKSGVAEVLALGTVCAFASEADWLVGFNLDFNRAILESSLIRLGKDTRKLMRAGLASVDLTPACTAACRLSGESADGSYRRPRLREALLTIRNERPRQTPRDALTAAKSSKRLFLSLKARGYLDIGEAA